MVTSDDIEHYMIHRAACVWPSVLRARPRFERWLRHMERESVTSLNTVHGENVMIQLILEGSDVRQPRIEHAVRNLTHPAGRQVKP